MNALVKNWWKWLRYSPDDPRFNAGGTIKIVAIGGGTGLSTLLRGLKKYSNQITAIVAVTDDGASSGEIRKDFDMLPPGDIRQCISALAYDEKLLGNIFEFRFDKDKNLFGGHTLGNIWITALTEHLGSFEAAIEVTSEIFKTAGRVLPATLDNIELCAKLSDGEIIVGESSLGSTGKRIDHVYLDKAKAKAYEKAEDAIGNADLIIIGPGSLYTSVIPNLLISGIKDAILANKNAVKVHVMNCSTERGETANYSVEDHIRTLVKHSSKQIADYCIINNKVVIQASDDSSLGAVNNITTAKDGFMGMKFVPVDVISSEKPLYHDSSKLAKEIISLYNRVRES